MATDRRALFLATLTRSVMHEDGRSEESPKRQALEFLGKPRRRKGRGDSGGVFVLVVVVVVALFGLLILFFSSLFFFFFFFFYVCDIDFRF